MGFGSYDESEQENQAVDTEGDTEGVAVHENDHDGEVTFEADATTDELVGRLAEMGDDEEDESE
jgi:hypothetical protein